MANKEHKSHVNTSRPKHFHNPRDELQDHHQMIIEINHWSKVIHHNMGKVRVMETINLNLQMNLREQDKLDSDTEEINICGFLSIKSQE